EGGSVQVGQTAEEGRGAERQGGGDRRDGVRGASGIPVLLAGRGPRRAAGAATQARSSDLPEAAQARGPAGRGRGLHAATAAAAARPLRGALSDEGGEVVPPGAAARGQGDLVAGENEVNRKPPRARAADVAGVLAGSRGAVARPGP